MKFFKKFFFFIKAMALLLILPGNSFSLSSVDSLKGLKGVEVIVEELKSELEDYNISAIQIQKEVEALLKNSGIQVLSKEDNEKIQALRKPYLYVKVDAFKISLKRPFFAFNIYIALNQQIKIMGEAELKKAYFYCPTWYKSELEGVLGREVPKIIEAIKLLTEKFINDYKMANPNL